MPSLNEREMQRMADYVRDGCIEMGRRAIVNIHASTIGQGYGPGIPVDTGRARAGGRVSVGSPSAFNPPANAEGYPVQSVSAARAELAPAVLGDDLHWTDNVEYSALLEGDAEGAKDPTPRSDQARNGFLRIAIEPVKAEIENQEYRP